MDTLPSTERHQHRCFQQDKLHKREKDKSYAVSLNGRLAALKKTCSGIKRTSVEWKSSQKKYTSTDTQKVYSSKCILEYMRLGSTFSYSRRISILIALTSPSQLRTKILWTLECALFCGFVFSFSSGRRPLAIKSAAPCHLIFLLLSNPIKVHASGRRSASW